MGSHTLLLNFSLLSSPLFIVYFIDIRTPIYCASCCFMVFSFLRGFAAALGLFVSNSVLLPKFNSLFYFLVICYKLFVFVEVFNFTLCIARNAMVKFPALDVHYLHNSFQCLFFIFCAVDLCQSALEVFIHALNYIRECMEQGTFPT